MKSTVIAYIIGEGMSPLAEGRELKSTVIAYIIGEGMSPLAEGRELKCECRKINGSRICRPSRRGVN